MNINKLKDLKDFLDTLSEEQLLQEADFCVVDVCNYKIKSAYISNDDEYFIDGESMGNLKQFKQEWPYEWKSMIEEAIIVPKGTVFILNE